ncbi:MAG: phosphogluconate dehydrogenase (NADP(+)-dependent, decarboxylating) [Firmicutes bacterium HGW-Firmicutes-20]|jgi:6-phosphogluconate dehydrogenase|nr:MAG: phosphogluconate dehydrogenase (NADP(+)-dependent, decarboxylating) [Firmicutes bacterium HGW-Firmicutes-20]PKM69466.1 MAG: phosphogluconate dehydrogenase (NADP(+)-dependent, decarboxylating) [Firmicutes bacterium HGW-Firmicutes-19]
MKEVLVMLSQIGVIGMAVMGKNLALNLADHGFKVSIYNRTTSISLDVIEENPQKGFVLTRTVEEFVNSLSTPRKMIMMVQAGAPVDKVIESLLPHLQAGDILMDGGNSYYKDTIRRYHQLKSLNINYMGVGVSGGEDGARFGPAIMPSGDKQTYLEVEDMLTSIAAKAYGEPCCFYIGQDGSGHYVKMVHNGIEYGDMELIAEAYNLLKQVGGKNTVELQEIFEEFNKGELDSYLIEITAKILKKIDDETGLPLVDVILDVARQKGTGKWTAQESLDLNVDSSVLTSAVFARFISEIKDMRIQASALYEDVKPVSSIIDEDIVESIRRALYASKLIAYAQGFALLTAAAKENQWNLDFAAIAKGWRGGCIIRAAFLNKIAKAYQDDPGLKHLLLAPEFAVILKNYQADLRKVVILAIEKGVPVSAFANALSYFDAFTSRRLPANLIQAQRDFFGAHTFERVDKEGVFHEQW